MLTEKRKLDVDKKIHNYVLTEKKKKKNVFMEHRTAANPPQKPTHKAQRGGYAAVQSFAETKKNSRSSI
jgi:hypothetical protein